MGGGPGGGVGPVLSRGTGGSFTGTFEMSSDAEIPESLECRLAGG